MSELIRVLIIEDLPTDAGLEEREVRRVLPKSEFLLVETQEDFLVALDSFKPDLILSDYKLPHFDGMTALLLARERVPETPFIIITGSMNEDTAVECMKAGAWDYVIKEHVKRLGPAVISVLEQKELRAERNKADTELRKSEERFRTIFERSTIGKSLSTLDGKILKINKAFAEMLGYLIEEISQFDRSQFIHPEDLAQNQVCIHALLEGRQTTCRFEERYIHRNGSIIWADVSTILLHDEQGAPLQLIASIVDMTERKKSEEEKIKLEAKLHQSQKIEAVGRLAGGIAHDFNNMLSVIIGHTELMLMKMDPTYPDYAAILEIHKAAERSSNLTHQLLTFARKQIIAPKVLMLNELLDGLLKMLERLIGENIRLNYNPGENLWPVKADPSQLEQIFANLCVNARDAITDIGEITIEIANCTLEKAWCDAHSGSLPGDYVRTTVMDNGCGMSKEVLDHLFEPFFTTKEVGKGTGLGLSIVFGAIKQNDGFIEVTSKKGEGTAFTIYLPRAFSNGEQPKPEIAAKTVMRGHETILLVEDDPTILEVTKLILETLGYTILTANSPEVAMKLAKENIGEIQMLITDVIMPIMNGRDLAKNLLTLYPSIKRLFMSGYTAELITQQDLLEKGAYFIQKPLKIDELAIKVREVLDS